MALTIFDMYLNCRFQAGTVEHHCHFRIQNDFVLLVPLILALLLNEVTEDGSRALSIRHLPAILSVLDGAWRRHHRMFSLNGPVNGLLGALDMEPIMFMLDNHWFRGIIIGSDVWKGMGYNMIVMLATITGIHATLYEAAK